MTDDNNNNADHESWNVHLSVAHADTVFHGCGLKVLAHCQLCPYLWGTVWITRPTQLVTRPEHGTLTHTHVKHCEAMRRQPTAGCSPDEITSKISLKISQNHWRQLWTSGSLKSSWFFVTHRDPEMKETHPMFFSPSCQVMAMQGGHPTWRQCKVPNPHHLIFKDHSWAHKAINFAILPWSTWLGFSQIFTGNGGPGPI